MTRCVCDPGWGPRREKAKWVQTKETGIKDELQSIIMEPCELNHRDKCPHSRQTLVLGTLRVGSYRRTRCTIFAALFCKSQTVLR